MQHPNSQQQFAAGVGIPDCQQGQRPMYPRPFYAPPGLALPGFAPPGLFPPGLYPPGILPPMRIPSTENFHPHQPLQVQYSAENLRTNFNPYTAFNYGPNDFWHTPDGTGPNAEAIRQQARTGIRENNDPNARYLPFVFGIPFEIDNSRYHHHKCVHGQNYINLIGAIKGVLDETERVIWNDYINVTQGKYNLMHKIYIDAKANLNNLINHAKHLNYNLADAHQLWNDYAPVVGHIRPASEAPTELLTAEQLSLVSVLSTSFTSEDLDDEKATAQDSTAAQQLGAEPVVAPPKKTMAEVCREGIAAGKKPSGEPSVEELVETPILRASKSCSSERYEHNRVQYAAVQQTSSSIGLDVRGTSSSAGEPEESSIAPRIVTFAVETKVDGEVTNTSVPITLEFLSEKEIEDNERLQEQESATADDTEGFQYPNPKKTAREPTASQQDAAKRQISIASAVARMTEKVPEPVASSRSDSTATALEIEDKKEDLNVPPQVKMVVKKSGAKSELAESDEQKQMRLLVTHFRKYKDTVLGPREAFRKDQRKLSRSDPSEYLKRLRELSAYSQDVIKTLNAERERPASLIAQAVAFARERAEGYKLNNDEEMSVKFGIICSEMTESVADDIIFLKNVHNLFYVDDPDQKKRADSQYLEISFNLNNSIRVEPRKKDFKSAPKVLNMNTFRAYLARREQYMFKPYEEIPKSAFSAMGDMEHFVVQYQLRVEGLDLIQSRKMLEDTAAECLLHVGQVPMLRKVGDAIRFLQKHPLFVIRHDLGILHWEAQESTDYATTAFNSIILYIDEIFKLST